MTQRIEIAATLDHSHDPNSVFDINRTYTLRAAFTAARFFA